MTVSCGCHQTRSIGAGVRGVLGQEVQGYAVGVLGQVGAHELAVVGGITRALYTVPSGTYVRPFSQLRGTISSFYVFDGVGSVDRLLDSTGLIVTDTSLYSSPTTAGAVNLTYHFPGKSVTTYVRKICSPRPYSRLATSPAIGSALVGSG